MRWPKLVEIGSELPEVEESTWYRTPALKVRGKGLCRLREDGETVVFMLASVDEQEALIAARPSLYFVTDHYRGYAAVLAGLRKLRVADARERLRAAWHAKAPRSLTKRVADAI
jgi:hypothetical protein